MTAEEFLQKHHQISHFYDDKTNRMVCFDNDLKKAMIEFAQMHVEAALKAASDFKNHPDSFCEGYVWWIPSDSIINCYPKELIK